MDFSQRNQKTNPKKEAKRSKNQSSAPAQKDAYARLLNQHRSSKFSMYLEQYAKESSWQGEENSPSTQLKAQSERLNIPLPKTDKVPNDLSDSSDFSPSSMKSRGEESSLSMYMEKLSTGKKQQDSERNLGVFDRQRQGQRRDTTTSHDGDIESGEELCSSGPDDSKKQQRAQKNNKDVDRDMASEETDSFDPQTKATSNKQEQEKTKKTKKKNHLKHSEVDKGEDMTLNQEKNKPQQPTGKS